MAGAVILLATKALTALLAQLQDEVRIMSDHNQPNNFVPVFPISRGGGLESVPAAGEQPLSEGQEHTPEAHTHRAHTHRTHTHTT